MSKKINYYQLLEVSITSTSAEIRKSFQRLAMKYHPDRNLNDKDTGEKFKEIRKAYEVLIDAEKRSAYDALNAFGTVVADSEDGKYEGEWKDGEKHGQGTYTYPNGAKYKGEWKDGKMHGQGTFYDANGEYIGGWKDGKKHGKATWLFTQNKGVERFDGEMENDKANGQCTYIFTNGNIYSGGVKDNLRHGKGTYTWANGDQYIGKWKENRRHGKGTFTWANGDQYIGKWKDSKKNGKGTKTYTNGSLEKGIWKNDLFIESRKYLFFDSNFWW